MKKIVTLLLILGIVSYAQAQISRGGRPYSMLAGGDESQFTGTEFKLPFVDNAMELQSANDRTEGCTGCATFYGKAVPLSIDIKRDGRAINVPGGRLWIVTVRSETAKAMQFNFNRYKLPKVASLFIYNEDRSVVLGAFTHINNHHSGQFATQAIAGKKITLEYFEADDNNLVGELEIYRVIHVYRDDYAKSDLGRTEDIGDALSCELPVCPSGISIERSVCRISTVYNDNTAGYCTGVLVNNLPEEFRKPYVLTAFHCYQGAEVTNTADLSSWIFEFNLRKCDGTLSTSQSVNGASVVTGATDLPRYGTPTSSYADYILLDLETATLEDDVDVVYAGWSRNPITYHFNQGFHHPRGDAKKYSVAADVPVAINATAHIDTTPDPDQVVIDDNGNANPKNTWKVTWSSGITEPGSSGSPLFESENIVGLLKGGNSDCSHHGPDYYGMFAYSWNAVDYPYVSTLGEELAPNDPIFTMNCPAYYPPSNENPTGPGHDFTGCQTYVAGVGGTPTHVISDFNTETVGQCISGWTLHSGNAWGACRPTNIDPNNKAMVLTSRTNPWTAMVSKIYPFVQGREYVLTIKVVPMQFIADDFPFFQVGLRNTVPSTKSCGTLDNNVDRPTQVVMQLDKNILYAPGGGFKTYAAKFVPTQNFNFISLQYFAWNQNGVVIDDIMIYENNSFINNTCYDYLTVNRFFPSIQPFVSSNVSLTAEFNATPIGMLPVVEAGEVLKLQSKAVSLKPGFHAKAGSVLTVRSGECLDITPYNQPAGPLEDGDHSLIIRTSGVDPTEFFNYTDQVNLYRSDLLEASVKTKPIIKDDSPAIVVSPNPTKGKVFGEFITDEYLIKYKVYDTYGREMLSLESGRFFDFDLGGFSDGIYILKADIRGKREAVKILLRK